MNIYWDSDVFLALLIKEPGRASGCLEVERAAKKGQVQIITSAITIAEVLHLKGKPKFDIESRKKIESYFKLNKYIIVRNLSRHTAEQARDLIWENTLKPKDAIHLATAISAKVSLMHSFDADFRGVSNQFGDPKIVIKEPSLPHRLNLFE